MNVVVYGMNDEDAQKNKEWVEKQHLPFTVLLDTGREVGIAYGMSEAGAEQYVANAAEGRRPAAFDKPEWSTLMLGNGPPLGWITQRQSALAAAVRARG